MATISLEIPDTQIDRLKAWIDRIEPLAAGDPPRTNAEYIVIFKQQLKSHIQKAVKDSEWKDIQANTYNAIADIEVNDA